MPRNRFLVWLFTPLALRLKNWAEAILGPDPESIEGDEQLRSSAVHHQPDVAADEGEHSRPPDHWLNRVSKTPQDHWLELVRAKAPELLERSEDKALDPPTTSPPVRSSSKPAPVPPPLRLERQRKPSQRIRTESSKPDRNATPEPRSDQPYRPRDTEETTLNEQEQGGAPASRRVQFDLTFSTHEVETRKAVPPPVFSAYHKSRPEQSEGAPVYGQRRAKPAEKTEDSSRYDDRGAPIKRQRPAPSFGISQRPAPSGELSDPWLGKEERTRSSLSHDPAVELSVTRPERRLDADSFASGRRSEPSLNREPADRLRAVPNESVSPAYTREWHSPTRSTLTQTGSNERRLLRPDQTVDLSKPVDSIAPSRPSHSHR
jgi:hypothetical protein